MDEKKTDNSSGLDEVEKLTAENNGTVAEERVSALEHAKAIVAHNHEWSAAINQANSAWFGADAGARKLIKEVVRPTPRTLQGMRFVLTGMTMLMSGFTGMILSVSRALPEITEAVRRSKDADGAYSVAELDAVAVQLVDVDVKQPAKSRAARSGSRRGKSPAEQQPDVDPKST